MEHTAAHIETGLRGEEAVAAYLRAQGWEILGRRWRDRRRGGLRTDIDLVARSADGVYHFVEVKTRTGGGEIRGDFAPERALTAGKIARMTEAAERYLAAERITAEISVDVAAVVWGEGPNRPPVIRYYPDLRR
ncbi:MAG: YraN family protein [Rikenella sp.]|nr:YraN family protein [Rikenella sp.]